MSNVEALTPTQDERIMAALAHISALLPIMGVIAPIVIWVTQKEKSQYVAFQALAYHLSMIAAWFVGMGCYMLSFFATFITLPFSFSSGNSHSVSPLFGLTFIIPFLVFGAIFCGGFYL